MTVRDAKGVHWSVKQGEEGPVEVTVSRILSAVGYHQPPVYFLGSFTLQDERGTHVAGGRRFRPHEKTLKDLGEWYEAEGNRNRLKELIDRDHEALIASVKQ